MIRKILFWGVFLGSLLSANAQCDSLFVQIEMEGTLSTLIDNTQKNNLTTLVVSGTINGSDILFLREMAGSDRDGVQTPGKLSRLDLSNVQIESSGRAYYSFYTPIRNAISTDFFYGCSSLTSLILPTSVKIIYSNAFWGCSNLKTILIGSKVDSLSVASFAGCASLTQIFIDPDNQNYSSVNGLLFNKDATQLILYPKGNGPSYTIPSTMESIPAYLFAGCTFLKSVTIPPSIKNIEKYAFSGCTSLTTIKLPDKLTQISEGLFSECTKLDSIFIPNSVKSLEMKCFKNCSSLKEIAIPSSVRSIGEWAFESCISLTSIDLSELDCTLGSGVFYKCFHLTDVKLPFSLTDIPDNCFNSCTELNNITIPNNLSKIGNEAFRMCTGLIDLYIPNSVTTLGKGVFRQCTGLKSIDLSNNIRVLDETFYDCSSLTSILLPDSLKTLRGSVFKGCIGLTSLNIPEGDTLIGMYNMSYVLSSSFGLIPSSSIHTVQIPSSVNYISPGAFKSCAALQEIRVDKNNPNYCSIDGLLYDKSGTELKACPYSKSIDYSISDSLTVIGSSCFSFCLELDSIYIPDNVLKIQENAFYNCSNLTNVRLSENLESVGSGAFSHCTKLVNLTVPDNTVKIEEGAFFQCTDLSSLTLGMYTDEIGNQSFEGCSSLKEIHCRNVFVPTFFSKYNDNWIDAFQGIDKDACTVYVPIGTSTDYARASGWSDFKHFVEEKIVSTTQPSIEKLHVFGSKGLLTISGLIAGVPIEVFTIQGACIKTYVTKSDAIHIQLPENSIYMVRIGSSVHKVAL